MEYTNAGFKLQQLWTHFCFLFTISLLKEERSYWQEGSPTAIHMPLSSAEILDFDAGRFYESCCKTGNCNNIQKKIPAPVILPNGKCVIFGDPRQGLTYTSLHSRNVRSSNRNLGTLPPAPRYAVSSSLTLVTRWSCLDGREYLNGNVDRLRQNSLALHIFFKASSSNIGSPKCGGYGGTISIPTPDALSLVLYLWDG